MDSLELLGMKPIKKHDRDAIVLGGDAIVLGGDAIVLGGDASVVLGDAVNLSPDIVDKALAAEADKTASLRETFETAVADTRIHDVLASMTIDDEFMTDFIAKMETRPDAEPVTPEDLLRQVLTNRFGEVSTGYTRVLTSKIYELLIINSDSSAYEWVAQLDYALSRIGSIKRCSTCTCGK